jgi:hypothetical protein
MKTSLSRTKDPRDSENSLRRRSADGNGGSRSPAEVALLANFCERRQQRHASPRIVVEHHPPGPVGLVVKHGDPEVGQAAFLETFGTVERAFADRLLRELLEAGCRGGPVTPFESDDVNGALAAVHGIAPRDETEAMLACQMLATHSAAMTLLRRLKGSETIRQQESNGQLAIKLLRTYAMQVEALQRYRGKGQQKVTVEHVHVHSGGQAIVGAVSSGPGGGKNAKEQASS